MHPVMPARDSARRCLTPRPTGRSNMAWRHWRSRPAPTSLGAHPASSGWGSRSWPTPNGAVAFAASAGTTQPSPRPRPAAMP